MGVGAGQGQRKKSQRCDELQVSEEHIALQGSREIDLCCLHFNESSLLLSRDATQ